MDGAYFVSRTELLDWLNGTLRLSYTKVEQCCTGAAHCQVLDSMHPGKVQLHKVNFDAKLEHEYITNFKVLQSAFTAVGIKKMIEIEKLVKGKYQDNLEFLQWMKRFADAKMPNGPTNYDPVAVRETAVATQRRLKQPRKSKVTKEPASTRKEGGTPPVSPEHDSDAAERSQRSQQPPPPQQQQPPAQEEQRLSDLEASKAQRVLETLEVCARRTPLASLLPPHHATALAGGA